MTGKNIWTIGHSSHTLSEFLEMLKSFQIQLVADIRSFPGSRRCPHFNRENLEMSLSQNGINYRHLIGLGGRRKAKAGSVNTGWKVAAFRGYADYMETVDFTAAADELERLGTDSRTAYMCAEAVWWSCHRSLVSDYLKSRGWTVTHIMGVGTGKEHPYTAPARITDGRLSYRADEPYSLFPDAGRDFS